MFNLLKNLFGLGPKVDYAQLVKDGAIIIDVRSKTEFQSGSIKGSINIPLDVLSTRLANLRDKDGVIITCCASGIRSAGAGGILKSKGYANVYNGGGWNSLARKIK